MERRASSPVRHENSGASMESIRSDRPSAVFAPPSALTRPDSELEWHDPTARLPNYLFSSQDEPMEAE